MKYSVDYLLVNSKLPGPRSNLELLYEFIQNADRAEVSNCLDISYVAANTPEEFVLSCGVGASIYLDAADHSEIGIDLKGFANHESWRVREAICGFVKKSAVDKLTKLILGDTPVDLPQVHLEYFSAYATLLFEVFCIRYTKGGSPCGFDV